jgi:hypothetical protein
MAGMGHGDMPAVRAVGVLVIRVRCVGDGCHDLLPPPPPLPVCAAVRGPRRPPFARWIRERGCRIRRR